MKKNEKPFDLDELLRTVEHAGRDSRRQQQLAEMIDRLAAEEGIDAAPAVRSRRVRWTVAISAAACLLLFVTLYVKMGASGDMRQVEQGPLLAQSDVRPQGELPQPVEVSGPRQAVPSPAAAARRTETVSQQPTAETDEGELPVSDAEPPTVADQPVAPVQEIPVPTVERHEILHDAGTYLAEQPLLHEAEDSVALPVDMAPVAIAKADMPTDEPRERHPFLRLRRTTPSKMEGTVLAFRLL